MSVILHPGSGLDVVRLYANFETISTHFFAGVGGGNPVLLVLVETRVKHIGIGMGPCL